MPIDWQLAQLWDEKRRLLALGPSSYDRLVEIQFQIEMLTLQRELMLAATGRSGPLTDKDIATLVGNYHDLIYRRQQAIVKLLGSGLLGETAVTYLLAELRALGHFSGVVARLVRPLDGAAADNWLDGGAARLWDELASSLDADFKKYARLLPGLREKGDLGDFLKGLVLGLGEGAQWSVYGMLQMVLHPWDTIQGFAALAKELKELYGRDDLDGILKHVLGEDLFKLLDKFNDLTNEERGYLIGKVLAQYSLGAAAFKGGSMGVAAILRRIKIRMKWAPNCFPPDTLVATERGLRPMREVEAGDRVWAFDFVAETWRLCEVDCRHDAEYAGVLVTLTLAPAR